MTMATRAQAMTLGFFFLTGLALASVGCRKTPETETLLIAGSSTMSGYLEPVVKAFAAKNPTVNVVSEGGGSTAGIVALKHGAIDVAAVARAIRPAEDDIYLRDYLVARDGVGVMVNPANPVSDLSVHQLARIFEGEATKWRDVGGGEGAIVVVDRDKKSHVRKSFEELSSSRARSLHPAQDRSQRRRAPRPHKVDARGDRLLDAPQDGPRGEGAAHQWCRMTRPTMLSGRYPLSRSFYLAVHMNASPLGDKFIEFTLSKDGQELLASDGLLETY